MLTKIFVIFLSLQYCFTAEDGDAKRYKYERIFKSKIVQSKHMEPYLIKGDRQSTCEPPISCNKDYPYRTIEGYCNNLQNPYWGSSLRAFNRRLTPAYGNGYDSFRGEGPNQNPLPRPRDISYALHTARDPGAFTNDGITLAVMQWGQWTDHDLTFTPENEVEHCCDDFVSTSTSHPDCRPIDVRGDPIYQKFGVTCLQFFRSIPVDPRCSKVNHREQFNNLTAYIDGSQVYGSIFEDNEQLRHGPDSAFLAISDFNEDACTKICPLNILPLRTSDEGEPEFFGGDSRVEEQPGLTSIHTIFMRFHNDLALEFRRWYGKSVSGDFIYEEVRRIVYAVIQQITYNEFLPIVLGKKATFERGINIVQGEDYDSRYDPSIDATLPNVFAAAVFRFGHTLIPDFYSLPNNIRVMLGESFFHHTRTITRGTFPSDFIQGIAATLAQKYDHIMVDAIVNKLYAEEPFTFGSDLLARNIQRAREQGIPGYNAWRRYAGLSTFSSFDQLRGTMANAVVDIFQYYYKSVDDIDLFPALISEYSDGYSPDPNSPDGDSLVGPLLRELIGEQFQLLKFGDRFWFENGKQPKPFTRKQLGSIHRTLLSSLICAYTDAKAVQRYAMYAINPSTNPLISCSEILKTGVLNDITLYWR